MGIFNNTKKEFQTMVDVLQYRALCQPDRKAFIFLADGEYEHSTLTFSELDRQARSIAALLQSYTGVGECVLLLYPPGLEFITAFFGCLYAGVIAVPAYPPRHNKPMPRLHSIISDAQSNVVLTDASVYQEMEKRFEHMPELRQMKWLITSLVSENNENEWKLPNINSHNISFLQYTSGSTAAPKGVIVSHENLLNNESMVRHAFNHTENSTYVSWLPLFHDMGLIGNVLQCVYIGAQCILMAPTAFLQKPFRWLQAISKYRAYTSGGPNFAYDFCIRSITEDHREVLDLSSWTIAFNGSEPVRHSTLERFCDMFIPCGFKREAFYPCYGLAEATLFVTGGLISSLPVILPVSSSALEQNNVIVTSINESETRTLVGCGRIWDDQEVIIADPESMTLCSPDRIGEIWITGQSVAKGYWRNDEKTASTFRAYLKDTIKGPYMRTGDLGFIKDGELFITGRLKDLIIIRGRNHYPQDIELVVERCHKALCPGCGAAFSMDTDGEERLVIVQEVERQYRKKNLGSVIDAIIKAVYDVHELQIHSIVLIMPGSIPKTSSGKIQRHACRADYLTGCLKVVKEWKEPAMFQTTGEVMTKKVFDDVLTQVVFIISTRLGIEPSGIDVEKPIIYYGMDSLKAVELAHSVENIFGVAMPMSDFFEELNIRELASIIRDRIKKAGNAPSEVLSGQGKDVAEIPLSRGQKALWFIHQLNSKSPAYNIARAIRLYGDVDIEKLECAFQALVNRHAALRTTFVVCDGEPAQVIAKEGKVCFLREDASSWSDDILNRRICEEASRPFDIEKGPLFRVNLFERSDKEQVLLLSIHHIISDFWSLVILINELGMQYSANIQGTKAELDSLGLSYHDYIIWQENILTGQDGKKLKEYWEKQLNGELPVLAIPTDRKRQPVQTYNGKTISFHIDQETVKDLKQISVREGTTLFMTLLASFQVLLHRYTGQDDILVGSPASGRERAGFSNTVGYFVNPLVMRARFLKDQTFLGFLKEVRSMVLDAYRHQNYPFVTLVEHLQPERDLSRSPVFQVMFMLQKAQILDNEGLTVFALAEPGARMKAGILEFELLKLESCAAQFDLTVSVTESDGKITASIEYNTDLFDAPTIERMARHYCNILSDIAKTPEKVISDIRLLSKEEREMLLTGWNDTNNTYPSGSCIHELFEEQAESRHEDIAAVFGNEEITYGNLNRHADGLANFLNNIGVGPNTVVAIYMERSLDMVIGLLGVLKAGGAYLPLDTVYPEERLQYMLEDSRPLVLLTQSRLKLFFPVNGINVICIDEVWEQITNNNCGKPLNHVVPDNLAYIIYTSGSTGKPKGVQITHKSVVNFLCSMRSKPGFTDKDIMFSVTTLSFDISALEIFLPLICGGRVVISPKDAVANGAMLNEMLDRYGVTVMQATPVTWQMMLEAGWNGRKELKILCGGEMLSRELADELLEKGDSLWNMYGPTETTIWSAVNRIESTEGPVTIGGPIANTQIYILDSKMVPVPIGVTGELYIGGHGLSRGYLNRADLTQEGFIPSPFDIEGNRCIYRTGDLARYLADGNIEVLGRIDNQVKIRGFRIELGEIEAILNKHPSIINSVSTMREMSDGDKRLVAYYTGSKDKLSVNSDLRKYLKDMLPEYMIPSNFIHLEHLPLTPNGKVDRKALPALDDTINKVYIAHSAPENDIERDIAEIWKEVLNTDNIRVNDRFFDIGGHSLLLTRVYNSIVKTMDQELTGNLMMVDMFKYPTIRSLADYINTKQSRNKSDRGNISKTGKYVDNDISGVNRKRYKGDIAVIGMAGRFPGARNIEEFWQNLKDGVESITFFSDKELTDSGVSSSTIKNPGYIKARGIIENAEYFDANFFGFSPREAEILDPQHRIFLECAWEALEDAGYNSSAYTGIIGLYASVGLNHYLLNNFSGIDPVDSAENYQLFIGNDKDFVPTRVSYKLDLRGPSVNVQTACSSSLVGVHMACRSIFDNECDIALAGGVSIRLPQKKGYMYQEGGIPSPDGHCRAFDEKAEGTVFGNGAGIVVLKPLDQALTDGDHIYAVIKGSAVNNDGALKIGYTAPSIKGQAAVIRSAFENADVEPDTVTYIETHGTGTELGDPIEIEALKEAFGNCTKREYCGIGSVKTNIGHLDIAAGIAGFIKTAIALKHRLIPQTLHYNRPNPQFDLMGSPFYINDRLKEWESEGHPRQAGVSSFGIGGTNVHVILEEPPPVRPNKDTREWELMVLSAKTQSALKAMVKNLAIHLKENLEICLADVAYTLQIGREAFDHRYVFMCRNIDEAIDILENYSDNGSKMERGMDSALAEYGIKWTSGGEVDWKSLYSGENRHRIPLPVYPFEREKYLMNPVKRNIGQGQEPDIKKDMSDWFYIPSWKRSMLPFPLKSNDMNKNKACWLVFSDKYGIGLRIAKRLDEQGHNVIVVTPGNSFNKIGKEGYSYTISPGNKNEYDILFEEFSKEEMMPDNILYFWGIDRNSQLSFNVDNLKEYYDIFFHSLLFIAQSVGKYSTDHKIEITVVTNHMWRVEKDDSISALKSLLLGPIRVIPQEYNDIECRCIDIQLPKLETVEEEYFTRQLFAELLNKTKDKVVSYRGNNRWVQAYENVKIDTRSEKGIRYRDNGVYLITGGLGGIGLELAEYLVGTIKARLILTSRTTFPERDEWSQWISEHGESDDISIKIKRIKAMEDQGAKVDIFCADIADIKQTKRVVENAIQLYGTIDGVMHAAGVPGGGIIPLKTTAAAESVLLPKVKGTLVLHESLECVKPDFFMLCSSITSITGGFGQVDYTAANAFLDAFAEASSQTCDTFYVSINWDRWKGTGMAAGESTVAMTGFEIGHPLLDRHIHGKVSGGTYFTEFSVRKHWVLSEHTVADIPTVPGTTYIEMARASFEKHVGTGQVEIRDVVFTVPLQVSEGEVRKVFTVLVKNGEFYEFRISSMIGSGNETLQEHAGGEIQHLTAESVLAGMDVRYDVNELISKYSLKELPITGEQSDKTGQTLVKTGPRWNSIKKVYSGKRKAIAVLELSKEYSSDIKNMLLHPALLDIATGMVRYLVKPGNYLPLAYEKMVIFKRITTRIHSYIELKNNDTTDGEMISCNVHILDEKGYRLIEIEGFTMRRVGNEALAGLKSPTHGIDSRYLSDNKAYKHVAATAETGTEKSPDNLILPVNTGLTTKEGIEIFERIISGSTMPQVIVSTRDIGTVVTEMENFNESKILKGLESNLQKPAHARPEISSSYTAPESEIENKIFEVWQKVLGIDRIGVNDNFFELGGTSLTGIKIVSELKKVLDADISTVSIFEAPTIKLLARLLDSGGDKEFIDRARSRAEKKNAVLQRRTRIVRRD